MSVTPLAVQARQEAPQAPSERLPAQEAMLVALALAAAAEAATETRARAFLAGRIGLVDFSYNGAYVILRQMSKAMLMGEFWAEKEWNHRIRPLVIPASEHERLTRALGGIAKEVQKNRVAEIAMTFKTLETSETFKTSDTSETLESAEEIIMRANRLARAEVVKAGRKGYAEAVSQAVGDDDDFIWKFVTDADPCPRCVVLATKTFQRYDDAPEVGAHINCQCVLTAEQNLRRRNDSRIDSKRFNTRT